MVGRLKFGIDTLVDEILDNIPEDVFKSNTTTFLDPAMGGGQFLKNVILKLRKYGHSDDNISGRVFGYESDIMSVKYAKKKCENVGTFLLAGVEDMNEKTNKHMNVIIQNAPYLKGTWFKFLENSISLNPDILVQVSPDGTGNYSARSEKIEKTFLDNGLQTYKDCTEYFPNVESGKIIYAIMELGKESNKNALADNSVIGNIVKKVVSHNGTKVESILSKNRSAEYNSIPRSDTFIDGKIKNLESVTKDGMVFKYIDEDKTTVVDGNQYWFTNRYFGKGGVATIFECNEVIGIGSNIMAIEKIKDITLDEFKETMMQPVKIAVLDYLRGGGFDTSPRHLRQVSYVDDNEFNLNKEEIDYIEANVK